VLIFLAMGLLAELLIAFASTALVNLSTRDASLSQQAYADDVLWTLTAARGPAGVRYASQRERGLAWSPQRAVGPPDTPRAGDLPTAWASATADGDDEWLELDFDPPVAASELHVYESYNPGAIARVCVFDESGREHEIFHATTSHVASFPPGTLHVAKFPTPTPDGTRTRRVKLYLDSRGVPGWNEIDAVALVDEAGAAQWATAARASSWYDSQRVINGAMPRPLTPTYGRLGVPRASFSSGAEAIETRVIEARGWPLPALWGEVKLSRADPAVSARALPLRPIWHHLVVDAALLAAALGAIWLVLTRPVRFIKESARARRGACIRCGYDLQFDLKQGCPECGWRR
jgi:hypothetical protein